MISVSIVAVTSYTGLELVRLLAQLPVFCVSSVSARSAVGKQLGEVFPQLHAIGGANTIRRVDPALLVTEEPEQTDVAFVCLPHAAAAESVLKLLTRGIKVVDLSADFRLRNVSVYEEWYKHVHPAPWLLETAVYGLCERYRERIGNAALIANPGCHVTASILALIPAFAHGVIEPQVIIDSKSGVSGAGRSLSLTTHYAEVNEDVSAYSLTGHRHLPEIVQELEAAARDGGYPVDDALRITFVPHLIPMTRGILATCYADLKPDVHGRVPTAEEMYKLYEQYYANEPFVHVVNQAPHTKWTYGSNHCFVYPIVDARTHRLVVVSCLDNLVKGAAGQAVQNANRLCGLPETTGLSSVAVYP
ncbi:MAG: N-acetyl-gamma-glutamyl-phosphate reductase [Ktedonobacteraceae bacterium]|nr:N-acetyl-gamma-glutamyl-phosphate reductase [Ktedonobacteraceae bacterium]